MKIKVFSSYSKLAFKISKPQVLSREYSTQDQDAIDVDAVGIIARF